MKIDHKTLKKIPIKKRVGIYFLFKNQELVYIGKSTDIFSRIEQHKKDKVFTHFSYQETPLKELNETEKDCIKYYNPKINENFATKIVEEVLIIVESNFAKYHEKRMYFNIDNKLFNSQIKSIRDKKGYYRYRFLEIKGSIFSDGSAFLNRITFSVNYKSKTYYFKNVSHNMWQLCV